MWRQIFGVLTILQNHYRAHFKAYKQVLHMFLVAFESKNTFHRLSETFEAHKIIFFVDEKLVHTAAFWQTV